MTPGQSKTGSVIESLTNIAVGAGIAFTSQLIIFGFYGLAVPASLNLKMTGYFTVVSIARSFVLRRIFNRLTYKYYSPNTYKKTLPHWAMTPGERKRRGWK